MDYIQPFTKEINVILGGVVAILAFIFGDYWYLFGFFLLFNVLDYLSGWAKVRINGGESSHKGLKGVIKKFLYWIMIAVAFGMSVIFIEIGKIIGIDLGITKLIGWFVLASLMINEIRSILENLVEAHIHVPGILINSLEVADKVLDRFDGDVEIDELGGVQNMNLNIKEEDLQGKDEIRLKISRKDE